MNVPVPAQGAIPVGDPTSGAPVGDGLQARIAAFTAQPAF